MAPQVRESFEQLARYAPPGAVRAAIRLDANEAPEGPMPAALAALAASLRAVNRYPTRDGELIERLAQRHGVPTDMVALGNGIDGMIAYLSDAFLEPGDEIVTGWPSFPTYVTEARKRGATVRLAPLQDGAVDAGEIAERIGPRTKLVWVCTPNNPTGGALGRAALVELLDATPPSVLVIVDEAYFEYGGGPRQIDAIREFVLDRPNVAAARTFSKIYGLASLRVGYLVGPAPVATAAGKARRYYDVTELGNIAAMASLDQDDELQRRRLENERTRERLRAGLEALGLAVLRSQANFLAVSVGDADAVCARLYAHGVATRPLSALGAPELLRIAVGTPAEIDGLLALLPNALGPNAPGSSAVGLSSEGV
jgi:histidinol-phosphate aminotransferase